MALTESKVVQIKELRFKPANSNDRARAGLQHAFRDVPPCSFAKDDGISPYIGSDAKIDDFPDTPATHVALHEDVPAVSQETPGTSASLGVKLLRGGFALSVFLHAAAAAVIGYASLGLPDDSALNEGETVIAVTFHSESEADARASGQDETVDAPDVKPVEQKIEEPKPVEPVKEPVKKPEPVKPVEQANVPEPVKVEEPVKAAEPVPAANVPEVLTTTQPSEMQVEAAGRQILETVEPVEMPAVLPEALTPPPVEEKKPEPVAREEKVEPKPEPTEPVVQDPVEQAMAELKDVPRPVQKPEFRKEEPKPEKKVVDKPEKKKPVERAKKVKGNQGADENNARSGSREARNKGEQTRDASEGGSNNREIGNAAVSNYKGLVQRKLERAKRRVRVAGKGSVTVKFTIAASGSVSGLRVVKSSGKPAVDKGALDVVRKASPFPDIPSEAKRKSWSMSVPMTFK